MELIAQYGLTLVFVNVLLERAGLPLPATPTLLICGALAATGRPSVWSVFALALLGCVIGDTLWYAAGRYYGRRVMKFLCRVSLSPDSCVRTTENRFERWGRLTLVLAKFVPGLSTVVRPLAGAMRLPLGSFELLNGLGSILWAGAAIGTGMLFQTQIGQVLLRLRAWGTLAGELTVVVVLIYIAYKWWERRRFNSILQLPRISPEELRSLMAASAGPIVIDVRSALGREHDRRCIPGALEMSLDEVSMRAAEFPGDREIVFYCECPNDASAAVATRKMMDRGLSRVRPLRGGLDGWAAAGYETESRPAVKERAAAAMVAAAAALPAVSTATASRR
ncbi:MAG TPA: VTT domain-containing protein [Steroidobacteraceae bacterium]|nr:VTT domain-containing protein [Steroidobacteraceae bacterium]